MATFDMRGQQVGNQFNTGELTKELWEIVKAVAEVKLFEGEGYRECPFCDLSDNRNHEQNCVVTRARILINDHRTKAR